MTTQNLSDQAKNNSPVSISGRVLMGMIGVLAFLLPIIVFFTSILRGECDDIQSSISAYYHTVARDGFVGMLCALAFALFAYKGYTEDDRVLITDNLVGNLAAIFALGVAFFPTSISGEEVSNCVGEFDNGIFGKIHYISAILLFLMLAYFSLFQFTKVKGLSWWEKKNRIDVNKQKRNSNRIYIFCGITILSMIVLAGIYFRYEDSFRSISKYKPIFILEVIMIWVFAFAWLHKSKYFGTVKDVD